MLKVYLAGAIAGLSYIDATDWRAVAKQRLYVRGIETLNPMRAKEILAAHNGGNISTSYHDYARYGSFFTSQGIMTRDFNDVKSCDALIVNLLGLTKPSLGSIMELAWAYALQKPAIVAIEGLGNPHDNHPMLAAAMSFRVETLDEAIDSAAIVLNR